MAVSDMVHQAFWALHAEWAQETERLLAPLAPETEEAVLDAVSKNCLQGSPNKLILLIKISITIGNCAIEKQPENQTNSLY